MPKYNGNDGVIKAITATGTPAAVGQVKTFSLETACVAVDATSLGDAWDKTEAGRKSWSGSVEAHYDPADAAQIDLIEGEKVDLELIPESGNDFSGTALVESCSYGVAPNEMVSVTVNFKGDGTLARAAVS